MKRLAIVLVALVISTTWLSPAEAGLDLEAVRTMLEHGQLQEARAALEPEVRRSPDNHEALYYLGYTDLALGDADAAIKHISRAVKHHGGDPRYHFWLAQAYGVKLSTAGMLGQMRAAPKFHRALERTLEIDPNHLQARLSLVEYCLQAPRIVGGGIGKAYEHARAAVELDERQGRLALARVYQQDGKLDAAEAEYTALEATHGEDPAFAPALCNTYGYFLLARRRYDEAIERFQRQVRLEPGRANPHDSLGDCYRAAGRLEQALAEYHKALEIDPEFAPSKKNAAEVERELRR